MGDPSQDTDRSTSACSLEVGNTPQTDNRPWAEASTTIDVAQQGTVSARHSTIAESACTNYLLGDTVSFEIVTRDSCGVEKHTGEEDVKTFWLEWPGKDEDEQMEIETCILNQNNGRYTVTFTPQQSGDYSLNILSDDNPLWTVFHCTVYDCICFDPRACHPDISLSSDLLTATRRTSGGNYGYTAVLGVSAMRQGCHRWKVLVTSEDLVVLGVVEKPLHSLTDSYNCAYSWCNNGNRLGPFKGHKVLSRWRIGSIMQLQLDFDQCALEIKSLSNGEQNQITVSDFAHETLYPYFALHGKGNRIQLLD